MCSVRVSSSASHVVLVVLLLLLTWGYVMNEDKNWIVITTKETYS